MASQAVFADEEDLRKLDPSKPSRFADGTVHEVMARLRAEDPVHYCEESPYGPYWSITKHRDIIEIEAVPATFSSDSSHGGISIFGVKPAPDETPLQNFIAMDPPQHTAKRRTVAPSFTPSEIQRLSSGIRNRTADLLDSLPRNEEFDWVENVSIALTRDMLATLFDYPWKDRDELIFWSNASVSADMIINRPQERMQILSEMAAKLKALWDERSQKERAPDLLSTMIHSDALGKMGPQEFIGNMALLIVGGNDTTRNTMSAFVAGINQFPGEWQKLLDDEKLIANAVNETIRWQTPVAHMRRTAVEDTEFRGRKFRAGDKIVMWYVSANRDESVFDDAASFKVDRENARRHLGFGYGVHRCVGARLAELQLQILLTEMRKRDLRPELVGDIVRGDNPIINGIVHLPVRITG